MQFSSCRTLPGHSAPSKSSSARDVSRGYYTPEQATALYGVVVAADGAVDETATTKLRNARRT